MNKAILTLILMMTISLIAIAAQAEPVGPGFGQDPGAEPPRAGIGNANSGNHNMHVENSRNRWSYGVDETAVVSTDSQQMTLQNDPVNRAFVDYVVQFSVFFELSILR